MAAHHAGRLTEAEVGYSRVLRTRANDPQALYGLGLLSFHSGAIVKGIEYLRRCVESAPTHGRAWITLGSMHIAAGDSAAAVTAFWQATDVAPDLSDGWYNAGICLKNEGDVVEASAHLRRALACPEPNAQAFEALASLLYQHGQTVEAAETYAAWAAHEPRNPKALHMAAAAAGTLAPARASDEYVRTHFDAAAASFDGNLQKLGYRAPQIIASALARGGFSSLELTGAAPSAASPVVLDAGCGTGLCGPLIRKLCGRLVGVDLSPKMLALARLRGCYDELVAAELSAFMRSRPNSCDAIVCADTLVYFGALDEPLRAAHQALRPGGTLVFTVEALTEGSRAEDFRLELSGRYVHAEGYLRGALGASGFGIDSISRETLREERSQNVAGYVVVSRRN